MKLLLIAAATTGALLDPAVLTIGLVVGLVVGLHIGGRHAIRRTGVGMVRGGARRLRTGRLS